jgi:hypothetical protein
MVEKLKHKFGKETKKKKQKTCVPGMMNVNLLLLERDPIFLFILKYLSAEIFVETLTNKVF